MPYSIYQVLRQQAGQIFWIKHRPLLVCTFWAGFFYVKISVIAVGVFWRWGRGGAWRRPLLGVAEDVLLFALHLGKVKFRARHSPVDVLDVVAGGLEVCRGVVRAGDKDLERGNSGQGCARGVKHRSHGTHWGASSAAEEKNDLWCMQLPAQRSKGSRLHCIASPWLCTNSECARLLSVLGSMQFKYSPNSLEEEAYSKCNLQIRTCFQPISSLHGE